MKSLISVVCFGLIVLGGPEGASAQEEEGCYPPCREGYTCHPVRHECVSSCNPPCRSGYVCDADRGECVSPCNPPCGPGESCSDSGECITEFAVERVAAPPPSAARPPIKEVGDRRFRLGILGRFGFGGSWVLSDEFGNSAELAPGATLGLDLRFEKPPAKYVSLGVVLGNYWILPEAGRERDYALDVSMLVKPRYPFKAGKREAEAYLFMQFGGSMILLNSANWDINDFNSIGGGFNFAVGPGFQIFVSDNLAVLFEIDYSYSWFGLSTVFDTTETLTLGQATIRTGIVRAF
jgi:hypothetical protein